MNQQVLSQMHDDAAHWVARMDADSWSEADEAKLQLWLRENPMREGALLRAQSLWVALDREPQVAAAPVEEPQKQPARMLFRRGFMAGGITALAASLAIMMLPLSGGGQVYETQTGEIRQVPLADGSSIAINTASQVAVDMKPDVRLIHLEKGEAWFKVAKNKHRPFLVEAGNIWVRAVGTAFSVRRRADGADVLVTEGVVSAWSDANRDRKVSVAAGGHVLITSKAQIVQQPPDPAGVDRQLAWRGGKIELVDERLGDAVAEFNRYNARKIVLADDGAAAEQVDGTFRTDDPESFAVAVHDLLGVPLDASDPRVIRLGAKKIGAAG